MNSEREKKIKDVSGKVSQIAAIDPDSLARTDDLTKDINFGSSVSHFAEMIDVMKQLSGRDLSRLPTPELNNIEASASRLQSLINEVMEFKIDQDKPGEVCRGINQRIAGAYDGLFNNSSCRYHSPLRRQLITVELNARQEAHLPLCKNPRSLTNHT
ncbi:MAG: hypothetical protein KDB00_09100 [Planctomycetales bacterium]|nr:hypothetical protein [Planctomycetales bacterium]MCA9160291.1 hypothetical protein [Planctomycetales bacterium]